MSPGLERIAVLLDLMAEPHRAYPIIHVAGTNGKTTTVGFIRDLLHAHGLRAGTFVSPHLHHIEERFSIAGNVLTESEFVQAVADVAPFVEIFESRHEPGPTYFELTAAIAFQAFAAAGVDAGIVEVGLGGRLDATNVVDADVSVITGIAMDHMSYLGDSLGAIAGEKAAIVKQGGTLVTGRLPAAAEGPITARVDSTGSSWYRFGADYEVDDVAQALVGWHASIRGLFGVYDELYLPLHGRHQVDHLAAAIAASELFFGRALDLGAVREASAAAQSPGRIEVVGRNPLVVVDGAHNEQGVAGLAEAIDNEFPSSRRILVVGVRGDRDLPSLLAPLAGLVDEVIVTQAADPAAVDPAAVAAAAGEVFGPDVPVEAVVPVLQAVTEALDRAAEEDMVVVTGSLYVVGEARTRFLS